MMARNDGRRDYVWERHALVQDLEKMELEVELLHKFLVARGDNITVRMRCGREVCETDVSQENIHARRWSSSVVKRLSASRSSLVQCCNNLVVHRMRMSCELEMLRRSVEESRAVQENASAAEREAVRQRDVAMRERDDAMRERDDTLRKLEAAEADVRIARQQADTTWLFVEEVTRGGGEVVDGEQEVCAEMQNLSIAAKGKTVCDDVRAEGGSGGCSAQGSRCKSCDAMVFRLKQLEGEMVRLEMTNEILQYPTSFWDEWDKEIQSFVIPDKFPPPPALR
ncbi:hypothetical protein CBR_g29323 [Chara braunii]|uniref:Uncharacterized protein n=1 Tax=Chara braunii TaxID=69332 RepID=A0A388JWH4_CHABU|nr:hypothetical protein CBR_g29323 [Chara braunii]|eukprot:GBG62123.1 hypothetical protein CBR_g29323 [Chara braunii]